MTFFRDLDFVTEGISVLAPLKYRYLNGVIADLWVAEGQKGAGGYYMSRNPRIVIFFSDVGQSILMANDKRALSSNNRPMGRAAYIPAGTPVCSHFVAQKQFQHLDLYLDARVMESVLAPQIGRSAALTALKAPVELHETTEIGALAGLVAQEVTTPRRHGIYTESLVHSIVGAMLALPADACSPQSALSEAHMRRLRGYVLQHIHRRIGNAELADQVRLSESWFAHVFKQTTGETPQQWQSRLRVERARDVLIQSRDSLSDVAHLLGFSDQAHLTRVFRDATGVTPGAWRRQHSAT